MSNHFQEILKNPIFQLPVSRTDGKSYNDQLHDHLMKFRSIYDKLSDGKLDVRPQNYANEAELTGLSVKSFLDKFIESILDSVSLYLDGRPGRAYHTFANALNLYAERFSNRMATTQMNPPQTFYRMRKTENETMTLFSKREMFHMPFSKRGQIVSQRFSISGYPSLYLGDSVYVCWKELGCPPIETIQLVRLESTKPLHLLELSPTPGGGGHESVSYFQVMTWPLTVACCHRVAQSTDSFKPEYIIPQFLLQWIRDKKLFDGIRYKSNHLETEHYETTGRLNNIVLPAQNNFMYDYCTDLASKFNITSTFTMPAYNFTMGGFNMQAILRDIKTIANMPEIEVIKGFKRPYHFSVLGYMEQLINSYPASPLE